MNPENRGVFPVNDWGLLLGTEVIQWVPRFSELICIALWFAYYYWARQMPWLENWEILSRDGINLINKNDLSA